MPLFSRKQQKLLGIFSEHTCLKFVIEAVYSGLPTAPVHSFLDTSGNRLVDKETDIYELAEIFNETLYDRLPIVNGEVIVGQVSRRDVLMHSGILSSIMKHHLGDAALEEMFATPVSAEGLDIFNTLTDHTVTDHLDNFSHTIEPDLNLFSIAQSFFESPHRHFPVLDGSRLIGIVNRSDVLKAAIDRLKISPGNRAS